jgi:hypothetical protein
MSKRGRSSPNDSPPPSFDEVGEYLADSGSDGDDRGGGSGSEARVSLALPDTSSFFAVPSSSMFAPPPLLERTLSCHTSSPASSMASPPLGPAATSSGGGGLPSLFLRQPSNQSNQSDSSLYSPVHYRDGGSLSHAPHSAAFEPVQPLDDSVRLAADNVALTQRLMQLEAELRTLKPRAEEQQLGSFSPMPPPSSSAVLPAPHSNLPPNIGFRGVPVLDFTTLLQLPPTLAPVHAHAPAPAPAVQTQDGVQAKLEIANFPFVFASAKFGNQVTLLEPCCDLTSKTESIQQQQQQQQTTTTTTTAAKPYAADVDDLRALIKQQQKELDYFRHAHKSVVVQQGRLQAAAVEKARADSAEAQVLQLQQQLSATSSALSVAENALRSDAAFRSALVKHFPDLSSASAVIYRVQEMQQRQLQLESDLCAAKNEAAAATAAGAVLGAQMSSANKFQQQLQAEQQDLLQKLGKAEAAAAAAVAAAAARESVVKMFDFEKFVEVWRE